MSRVHKYRPGATVRFPLATYNSADPAESVTVSGLTAANLRVYKNGGTTERASDAGETVTVDFDTVTGIHHIAVDTADNSTAGFYESGAHYDVIAQGLTVATGSVAGIVGSFMLGQEGSVFDGMISGAPSSQTEFVIGSGSGTSDAYARCPIILQKQASADDVSFGFIKDYTVTAGPTRTITLALAPEITIADGDHVSIMPRVNVGDVHGWTAEALMRQLRRVRFGKVGTHTSGNTAGRCRLLNMDGTTPDADGLVAQSIGFLRTLDDGVTNTANENAVRVLIDYDPTNGDASFGYGQDTQETDHPFNNIIAVNDLWVVM